MGSRCGTLLAVFLIASLASAQDYSAGQRKGQIYASLVLAGIDDALVDVTDQRVLIVYNQPVASGQEITATWLYMAGAAVEISPQSRQVIIVTANHGEQIEKTTIQTQDMLDFVSKRMDATALTKRILTHPLMAKRRRCQPNSIFIDGECVCERGFEKDQDACVRTAPGESGLCCLMGLGAMTIPAMALAVAAFLGVVALIYRRRRG
jgi:hypothetical protein